MASGKQYYYGMRLRGFSPGCQPMYGLDRREDDTSGLRPDGGKYHDILVYWRPLSAKELEDYELDYIQEVG